MNQEIDVLCEDTNFAVVKLSSRKYPGILIQGDSLFALYCLIGKIDENLSNDELKELVKEIRCEIEWRLNLYEEVLIAQGTGIPYERGG